MRPSACPKLGPTTGVTFCEYAVERPANSQQAVSRLGSFIDPRRRSVGGDGEAPQKASPQHGTGRVEEMTVFAAAHCRDAVRSARDRRGDRSVFRLRQHALSGALRNDAQRLPDRTPNRLTQRSRRLPDVPLPHTAAPSPPRRRRRMRGRSVDAYGCPLGLGNRCAPATGRRRPRRRLRNER